MNGIRARRRDSTSESRWPFQSDAGMGPACAVVDARADGATLWAGSQKPHFARDGVARALGLPRVSHTERRQSRRLLTIKAPGKCLSFLIVRKLHGKNDCLVVLIVIELRWFVSVAIEPFAHCG